MQCEPLPKVEWRFDELPADDQLIRGVFFYEYFRESDKLRQLIVECRKAHGVVEAGGYMFLTAEARQLVRQETGGGDAFGHLVEAFMNCALFPNTPALQIKDEDWPRWLRKLEDSPAIRLCGGEVADDNIDTKQAMAQIVGKAGIDYHFSGKVRARECESIFPIVIDWRKSDQQITEELQGKVLVFRPERFSTQRTIPRQQNGFGSLCTKLPFKPISGLNWLGVLRRFNAANKKWLSVLQLYDKSAKSKIDKGDRGFVNWRQNQIDMRNKARSVLKWLDSGARGELASSDFR